MEAECFGGEESASGNANAHQQSSASWRRERTRNAFMLVYDRVMPQQQQPQQQHGEPTAGGKDDNDTSPLPPDSSPPSPGASTSSSPASPPPPPPPLSVSPDAFPAATDNGGTDADALPRAGGSTPILARGAAGVSPDANVHGQEGTSSVRGRRRRKRFKAKVPAVFMRQIHQENLEFWRFGCLALNFYPANLIFSIAVRLILWRLCCRVSPHWIASLPEIECNLF